MTLNELIKELQYWETDYGKRPLVFIHVDPATKPEDLKIYESLISGSIEIKPL